MTLIEDNAIVLFQGDSITDAGRSRTHDMELGQWVKFVFHKPFFLVK